MKIIKLAILLFFVGVQSTYSQQISGKVIDSLSLQPIANVAVQYNKKIGVFSDVNGRFTIEQNNVKELTFSCLGYKTEIISLAELKKNNFLVILKEIDNNIDEVIIQTKNISIDSLLIKVKKNIAKNYPEKAVKQTVYYRGSNNGKFSTIELELDRSSLLSREKEKLANNALRLFAYQIKTSNNEFFKEYIGNFYSKKEQSPKLKKEVLIMKSDSLKGLRYNSSSIGFSIDGIQKKAQQLVLSFLDTTKTYKMKSGFFKLEDSVSIKEMNSDISASTDSLSNVQSQGNILNVINNALFFKTADADNFLSTEYYDHQIIETQLENNHWVYVVHFSPRKSAAKFEGTLFINDSNFAVEKVSYSYADGKRGEHLNLKFLMGVKFSENLKTGTIIYKKNSDNTYSVQYAKERIQRYFYVNRSLKFIENSSKKSTVKFSIKIEGNTNTTTTYLATKTSPITDEQYKKIPLIKRTKYISESDYEKSNWKNGNLLNKFETENK